MVLLSIRKMQVIQVVAITGVIVPLMVFYASVAAEATILAHLAHKCPQLLG
jgi:hypothetical protein